MVELIRMIEYDQQLMEASHSQMIEDFTCTDLAFGAYSKKSSAPSLPTVWLIHPDTSIATLLYTSGSCFLE